MVFKKILVRQFYNVLHATDFLFFHAEAYFLINWLKTSTWYNGLVWSSFWKKNFSKKKQISRVNIFLLFFMFCSNTFLWPLCHSSEHVWCHRNVFEQKIKSNRKKNFARKKIFFWMYCFFKNLSPNHAVLSSRCQ